MSSTVKVKTKIRNLQSLKAACDALGFKFLKNRKTCIGWGGSTRECEHAIDIGNKHVGWGMNIGLEQRDDGSYEFIADHFLEAATNGIWMDGKNGGKNPLGSKYGNLLREYALQEAKAQAKSEGHKVKRVKSGQTVVLEVDQGAGKKVLLKASAKGEIEMEAVGYKGKACEAKLSKFIQKLGQAFCTTRKAEYFEEEKVRVGQKQ